MTQQRIDRIFYALALFGVLLVPLAFYNYSYLPYEIPKIFFFYLISSLFFIFLAVKLKSVGMIIWNRKAVYAWLFFILINIIASLFAADKVFAFFGTRIIESVVFYIFCLGLMLGFMQVRKEDWRKIFIVVLYQGFFVSVFALVQAFFKVATFDYLKLVLVRPTATFGNVDFLAIYLEIAVLFTLSYLLAESKKFLKYLYAVFLAVDVWALVIAGSRAAWFSMGIVLLVYILRGFSKHIAGGKKILLAGLLAALLFVGMLPLFAQLSRTDRLTSSFSLGDVNVTSRLEVWKMCLQIIEHHPLLGLGPNNLKLYYQSHRPAALVTLNGYFDQAHNFFLEILVSSGILGFGVLIYYLYLASKNSKKIYFSDNDLEVTVLLGLLAILLSSMFGPLDIVSWFFIILFSAILLNYSGDLAYAPESLNTNRSLAAFSPLVYMLAAFTILSTVAYVAADQFYYWGLTNYYLNKPSEKQFRMAIALDPFNFNYYASEIISVAKHEAMISPYVNTAVTLQPNNIDVYANKSEAELNAALINKDKNLQMAGFADEDRELAMDTNNPALYQVCGSWALAFNDYSRAEYCLRKSAELNPQVKNTWLLLVSMYNLQNRFALRHDALEHAYLIDPLDAQLKHILAYEKTHAGQIPFSATYSE